MNKSLHNMTPSPISLGNRLSLIYSYITYRPTLVAEAQQLLGVDLTNPDLRYVLVQNERIVGTSRYVLFLRPLHQNIDNSRS